jgi:hypothetical protein
MIVENAGQEGSIVVQKVREGKGDFGTMPAQTNMKIFLPRVLSILPRWPVWLLKMPDRLPECS